VASATFLDHGAFPKMVGNLATTAKVPCRGRALRRPAAAALTDGSSSGGFTPEATGDARRTHTPELV